MSDVAAVIEVLEGEEANSIVRDYLLNEKHATEVSDMPLFELFNSINNSYIVATAEKSNIQLINEYLALDGVAEMLPDDINLASR